MWTLTKNGNAADLEEENYIVIIPSLHKDFYAVVAVVNKKVKALLKILADEKDAKEYVADVVKRFNEIEEDEQVKSYDESDF